MSWQNRIRSAVIATSLALPDGLAHAHHSGAIFDIDHPATVHGSVTAFQWANPHCFIELTVDSGDGAQAWSIEMGSPSQLYRLGWRPTTLRAGDAVTVVLSPMRDGSHGGQFLSATDAAGRSLGKPSAQVLRP
jgi:hypothetical protein